MTFDFFNALLLLAAAWFFLSQRRVSLESRAAMERQQAAEAIQRAELLHILERLELRLEQAQSQQLQRNSEQLAGVLHGVITDLQQRIVAGFEDQLARLTSLAAAMAELTSKHRNEQMEAMHHARRIAAKMDQAARECGGLLAESAALARLADDVRASLNALDARQDAADNAMAGQLATLQATADSVAALRPALEEIGEQLTSHARRAFDAMAQRSALSLSKELADSLAKATSGISKQLAALAPLAQQGKRGAEPPRMVR